VKESSRVFAKLEAKKEWHIFSGHGV